VNSEVKTPLLKQKLTPKQRKWIKVYSETLNATEAAMQAYDCKNRDVAKQIGFENITKLDFIELMDTIGLTDEYLVKTVRDGFSSSRGMLVNGKVVGLPDYTTRHRYLETALKLKGKLDNNQKLELSGPGGEPLQIQMVAGIGFLNKPKDDKNDPIS
jgi:hypothetical protein